MGRRVLVADDSATIQKVIKIAFSRHELEIVEAASLIEALAAVTRSPVDALILDASLPGARGPQDFVKLKDDARGVPVLLLVGTYDSVDEAAFRQAGFTLFLKKPFESSDIVQTIDDMLGGAPAMQLEVESTPPPPMGRPQHPTMIMTGKDAPTAGMTFRLDDVEEEGGPPPPAPVLDQARKGRRAFGEGEDTQPSRAGGGSDEATDPRRSAAKTPLPPIPPAQTQTQTPAATPMPAFGSTLGSDAFGTPSRGNRPTPTRIDAHAPQNPRDARESLESLVEAELPALVRQAVEDYCERHFKSLAREIIATELRRLADEKARHLVDN